MTKPYILQIIRRFLFDLVGMISLDRNYEEVLNLLFVLPGLYFNILKTEGILQFWDKRFSTCVAQEVKETCHLQTDQRRKRIPKKNEKIQQERETKKVKRLKILHEVSV